MSRSHRVRSIARATVFIATTGVFLPPPALLLRARPATHLPPPAAAALLDTAIARMGGAEALGKVERVRFEMMTLWQRMTFDARPQNLLGTYELHTDLRNYALGAWRNTRRFVGGPTLREMTDIVLPDVSIRRFQQPDGSRSPWAPLSVAYVDERRELFAFAPERLLLAARRASDLRTLPDTAIGGVLHGRVRATVEGFPTTIVVRRSDGLLAMARYRAAQPNDFGLAPWGNMEVEMWYSRWARYPLAGTAGVGYPTQVDVRRVGQLYKRLLVLAANFDAAAPADSFAVSDSLRAAYAAGPSAKAMWDLPLDSARLIEPRLAVTGPTGRGQSAVKLGNHWLLFEGTSVPQRMQAETQWLTKADPGSSVAGMLVSVPNLGSSGAVWFAERKLPVYVAPGAAAAVKATMPNWNQPASIATVVARPRWIRMGGDSVWVESIDYPDFPGALVAYVPSLRWVYSGMAAGPLNFDLLLARIRERGWTVDRIGSLRTLTQPLPPRTASR